MKPPGMKPPGMKPPGMKSASFPAALPDGLVRNQYELVIGCRPRPGQCDNRRLTTVCMILTPLVVSEILVVIKLATSFAVTTHARHSRLKRAGRNVRLAVQDRLAIWRLMWWTVALPGLALAAALLFLTFLSSPAVAQSATTKNGVNTGPMPENAFITGNGWLCRTGYRLTEGRCDQVKAPVNAIVAGNAWCRGR